MVLWCRFDTADETAAHKDVAAVPVNIAPLEREQFTSSQRAQDPRIPIRVSLACGLDQVRRFIPRKGVKQS
jgi:hypothetical protein